MIQYLHMVKELREKVENTIKSRVLLEKGDRVFVGFSGGPDSLCLLHILIQMREEWGLDLHAVHMNHHLRPGYADEDEEYSRSFCEKYAIPFHSYSCQADILAKERGVTVEEAGRQARYEAFDDARKKLGGQGKIAVAHNLNDQAETILLRLLRGTGTDGLAAMEYEREGGIIRPLLDVSRQDIEEYCNILDLKPRIDLSNLEPIYVRNKIRLELIPFLEKNYNSNIISALVRLGTIAKEDRDYFQKLIEEIKLLMVDKVDESEREIDRESYKNLNPAVGKRLINQTLKDIGMDKDITAYHLDQAHRMVREGKVGGRMDFPLDFKLALSYDKAKIFKLVRDGHSKGSCKKDNKDSFAAEVKGFNYRLNINGTTVIREINGVIKSKLRVKTNGEEDFLSRDLMFSPDNSAALLDFSKIENPESLVIRTRKPGDYITPLGMKGRKKIQDYFVDKKVPREKRDEIPMLCLGNEVLWVPQLGFNHTYKVKAESSSILYLEIIYPL